MPMSNTTFGTGKPGNGPNQPYNDSDQTPTDQAKPFPTQAPAKPTPNDPECAYKSDPFNRVK